MSLTVLFEALFSVLLAFFTAPLREGACVAATFFVSVPLDMTFRDLRRSKKKTNRWVEQVFEVSSRMTSV